MGAFWKQCHCGQWFMWFSHTPQTIYQSKQCRDCWKKEEENVRRDDQKVLE